MPIYPEIALKAGMQGTVIVKISVDKEGKPTKATIVKTDADIFIDSAIQAAMQWTFTPSIMNGEPTAVEITVPFYYKLK